MAVLPDTSSHVRLHVPALLLGMVIQAAPPPTPGIDVIIQHHMAAYVTTQGTAHLILDYLSYSEQVGSTVCLGTHQ